MMVMANKLWLHNRRSEIWGLHCFFSIVHWRWTFLGGDITSNTSAPQHIRCDDMFDQCLQLAHDRTPTMPDNTKRAYMLHALCNICAGASRHTRTYRIGMLLALMHTCQNQIWSYLILFQYVFTGSRKCCGASITHHWQQICKHETNVLTCCLSHSYR